MKFIDILNEEEGLTPKEVMLQFIDKGDWVGLLNSITKPSNSNGGKLVSFNVNGSLFRTRDDATNKPTSALIDISNKIKQKTNGEIKSTLYKAAEHISNQNQKDFIANKVIPVFDDPNIVKNRTDNSDKHQDLIPTAYYRDVGEALVYRSVKFTSMLANAKTEINQNVLAQLMVDAFNTGNKASEEENFLVQFTNINEKIRLDAAKQTVHGVNKSGDSNTKITDSFIIPDYDVSLNLFESGIEAPSKVTEFDKHNVKNCAAQVKAVEEKWPRQFKYWYDKYNAAFEDGVQKGQKNVREKDKKSFKDPLTDKDLGDLRKLGAAGPNAFFNDNPHLKKLKDDIKGQKLTIFNLGPRMVFKLFDMMEAGHDMLKTFKDSMADSIKNIKEGLTRSTNKKDFQIEIDKYIKNEEYGAANATAKAMTVVGFTQLLSLLQNGPIAEVDLDNKKFKTAMNNSQTSIEVAIQNVLSELDIYTDTNKRYESNREVAVYKNNHDGETETKSESTSPKALPFTNSLSYFILENDDPDETDDDNGNSQESDSNSDDSNNENEEFTNEDQEAAMLKNFELIKNNYDSIANPNRLKQIKEFLEKLQESNNNEQLKHIIDLYDLLASGDLKFKMESASLQDFLNGIKSYLDNFKQVDPIEIEIKIPEGTTKWPAMKVSGTAKKADTQENTNAAFVNQLSELQKSFTEEHIKKLNSFANEISVDWIKKYKAKIADADNYFNKYLEILKENIADKIPDWIKEYQQSYGGKTYLTKLFMIQSALTKTINKFSNTQDTNKPDDSDETDTNDER